MCVWTMLLQCLLTTRDICRGWGGTRVAGPMLQPMTLCYVAYELIVLIPPLHRTLELGHDACNTLRSNMAHSRTPREA